MTPATHLGMPCYKQRPARRPWWRRHGDHANRVREGDDTWSTGSNDPATTARRNIAAPHPAIALGIVRRRIATMYPAGHDLATPSEAEGTGAVLGSVTLLPHQRAALCQLRQSLDENGGALLADETGLGKTYVALALAAHAKRPLVIAPAALAPMWDRAMRRTGVHAGFRTTEGMGRRPAGSNSSAMLPGDVGHDLVVVDEAHHFRNPHTRRYSALARLVSSARLLLLSATPVHNGARDLRHLLALFAGSRAEGMDGATLARCVVRRGLHGIAPPAATRRTPFLLPSVLPIQWLESGTDEGQLELLHAILALRPPLPPADGGHADALAIFGLVRQWSSSVGALRGALRRRLVRAELLIAHLDAGHHLTSAELHRWSGGDDAVQLPIPGLITDDDLSTSHVGTLRDALVGHRDGVRELLRVTDGVNDAGRARALRRLRAVHAGEGMVAFSGYIDTIRALYRLLASDGGVCALHGGTAHVAGGVMTRDEALRRFAPRAHGCPPPRPADRITLLLTTDVVAEGINLQDAVAVVHVDMPWTAARLAQRVGRVARPGSTNPQVAVYAIVPPVSTESLLQIQRRLRQKWEAARRWVGAGDDIIPPLALPPGIGVAPPPPPSPTRASSPSEHDAALRARLRRWLDEGDGDRARAPEAGDGRGEPMPAPHSPGTRNPDTPAMSPTPAPHLRDEHDTTTTAWRVLSRQPGAFLAIVRADGRLHLVGARTFRGPVSDDPSLLDAVATAADAAGEAEVPPPAAVACALDAIVAWSRKRGAARALDLLTPALAQLQRPLLRRLARILRATPLHRRQSLLPLAADARRALTRPLNAAGESVLAALATAPMDDVEWLRALAAMAGNDGNRLASQPSAATRRSGDRTSPRPPQPDGGAPQILALLLILPPDGVPGY